MLTNATGGDEGTRARAGAKAGMLLGMLTVVCETADTFGASPPSTPLELRR